MNATRSLVCAISALLLCACGSIKSTQILGFPFNPPRGHVMEELKVGERPQFGATISRGSIDTIRNAWLDLRVGSGPTLRVSWNELDCKQISSQKRSCSYFLEGPAPAGAFVTSTWNARFRYGDADSETKNLVLVGTMEPHDLGWGLVVILSLVGPELETPPVIDGVYNLQAGQPYTISGIIKNNAGPVIPILAEARLDFDDIAISPVIVRYLNKAGLPAGATSGGIFAFTTPAATASSDGTVTVSFVSNDDDIDHTNDIVTLPIRVVP